MSSNRTSTPDAAESKPPLLAEAARCLESLGNETRLEIFRLLVRSGPAGLPVGAIQTRLGVPGSTLSHHLRHLVRVGLVRQDREGRTLHCRPQFDRMATLMGFLTAECCAGSCCFSVDQES